MAQAPCCDPEELRSLFLFEKLDDDQLATLCREGRIDLVEPGPVFREGDPATCFYVLIDGEVRLTRMSRGEEIETIRTDDRGVYAGAWAAYLGDRVSQNYDATMYVTRPSRFFVLGAGIFADLMREWFPMAVHLLEGVFFGNRNTRQILDQRERLLALGSLSAGLTHELNNPAAAAVRATESLRSRVSGMRHKLVMIAKGKFDPESLGTLVQMQNDAAEQVAKAPTLTPMEESDREDTLIDWFEDRGIADGWQLAPTFVQAGIDTDWLERVVATLSDSDPSICEGAIRWLYYTVESELLMNEIADSTKRVSSLVDAAKQYSQMDRAPFQVVDVHELLDSTLVMLSGKFGSDKAAGIDVVKDYDRSPARIGVLRGRTEPGVDEPDRQRRRRDGRRRHPHRPHATRRRLPGGRDRRHRTGRARRRSATASSSRSSPPNPSGRARASASTSRSESSPTSTTAISASSPFPATPGSSCELPLHPHRSDEEATHDRRHRSRPSRPAARAAPTATRSAAGGCTCAAAPNAGTSAAAIPRPPSTPPPTTASPATRSCRATNRARRGSGTTRPRRRSTARRWRTRSTTPSNSPHPDRRGGCRRTGASTFTEDPGLTDGGCWDARRTIPAGRPLCPAVRRRSSARHLETPRTGTHRRRSSCRASALLQQGYVTVTPDQHRRDRDFPPGIPLGGSAVWRGTS